MTLCHPKMQPHTKFGIPSSNNIDEMLRTQLFYKLGQRSRSQWPKNGMWHSAISRFIDSPNLEFLPQEYRSFAPDLMPILETRSEVKVTVTGKGNVTIRHFKMNSHTKLPSKMHLHTKFGIPTLKNERDVLQTQEFLKLGQRSMSQWFEYGTWHSAIPRYISTTNLEFLSQRI